MQKIRKTAFTLIAILISSSQLFAQPILKTPIEIPQTTTGNSANSSILKQSIDSTITNEIWRWKLANRFRPYLKFSMDNNMEERYATCSWKWFYSCSELWDPNNKLLLHNSDLNANPKLILDYANITKHSLENTKDIELRIRSECFNGEPWQNVENGHGIYAHVSKIDDRLINIEYWLLFGYNKCSDACNTGSQILFGKEADHQADLVGFAVIYDMKRDRLIRATYSYHGEVIAIFDLLSSTNRVPITFQDKHWSPNGNQVLSLQRKAIKVEVANEYQGDRPLHSPSPAHIFFIEDEQTLKFDHIVAYLEWGTHEAWPNSNGSYPGVPAHGGNSWSFLPKVVQLLSEADDAPFVFYSGKLGNDPAGIIRHALWYETTPRFQRLPVDKNPYTSYPNMPWPPNPDSDIKSPEKIICINTCEENKKICLKECREEDCREPKCLPCPKRCAANCYQQCKGL